MSGGGPRRRAGCPDRRRTRAINLAAYAEAGLAEIAAAHAFGICKARAFVDGNKRTAFVTSMTFLRLNGHAFRPQTIEGVRTMMDLAAGRAGEAEFARGLSDRMRPI